MLCALQFVFKFAYFRIVVYCHLLDLLLQTFVELLRLNHLYAQVFRIYAVLKHLQVPVDNVHFAVLLLNLGFQDADLDLFLKQFILKVIVLSDELLKSVPLGIKSASLGL